MEYLTLPEIKAQLIIDSTFTEDDNYLTHLGDTAEQMVKDHLDGHIDEIVSENGGELPSSLKHSMLMIVDYLYDFRGSDADKPVPEAFFVMCRPYVTYNIG